MSKKKPEKKSWIVTMDCKVRKSVVVDNCTEEQANDEPWRFSVEETEIDMKDWEVIKVEPND